VLVAPIARFTVSTSGNVDGNESPAPEQFGIHRTSGPCKPRIPGDRLDVRPVIANLVRTTHCVISERLDNSFATVYLIGYTTLGCSDTQWGYLNLNRIFAAYAERLLLENDNKLSHLSWAEEVLGALRLLDPLTDQGREKSYLVFTVHL